MFETEITPSHSDYGDGVSFVESVSLTKGSECFVETFLEKVSPGKQIERAKISRTIC